MTGKEKVSVSRFISPILRHNPQAIGITLDSGGWADTNALISGMNVKGRSITVEQLKEIVASNDKQRFKFNDDYSKIRANQGHSVPVDVGLKETQPPDVLYHGTASRFIGAIQGKRLIPQSRLYVHLSADTETAYKVGKRYGKPVVLTIDSSRMYKDGFRFYLSANNVWLISAIPAEYIERI
jgi:putative RNA 2'-phosphotransferase